MINSWVRNRSNKEYTFSMQFIDSHCHLDFSVFNNDRDQLIESARTKGVEKIIIPAVSRKNWQAVKILKESYAIAEVAYGLHPMFMSQHKKAHLAELRLFLQASTEINRPIAIGECGLDFYIKDADKSTQIEIFVEQLKIASDFSLPVIIHARKSLDIILKYVRKFPELNGVIHSFSGSMQQAEICMNQGFLLGFGGPVTYTRATKLRKLVVELPLEGLLLETDAPDQPDSKHWGQRNVPANLIDIATVVAELRAINLSEVAHITTQNAKELFKLELVTGEA